MRDSQIDVLREPLTDAQISLIQTIYEPFRTTGEWPLWQYVDLTLDSLDLDAAVVLSSLPTVRNSTTAMWGSAYALVWYLNPSSTPQLDQPIGLTVAGLNHVEDAELLLETFLISLRYLVEQQRNLIPSPHAVVEAIATSQSIGDRLVAAGVINKPEDRNSIICKLGKLLEHEPILRLGFQRGNDGAEHWTMRIPSDLRELRDEVNINGYLDRIVRWVAPYSPPPVPTWIDPSGIPNAIGYLDAVWKSKKGSHLFHHLGPTSVAGLTKSCVSEAEFNSLLSSLADVLGQIIPPGKTKPPQRGALEAFRDQVCPLLEPGPSERVRNHVNLLIEIRHIRVTTQHANARSAAVKAFNKLGLRFPPINWEQAWVQVGVIAIDALVAIREEVLVGISDDSTD